VCCISPQAAAVFFDFLCDGLQRQSPTKLVSFGSAAESLVIIIIKLPN
jgi:hypothetical protein